MGSTFEIEPPDTQKKSQFEVEAPSRPDFAKNPPPAGKPTLKMHYDPWGGEPEGMPGVSEGAGLAEGLSDYSKASAGQIGAGVGDIAHGDFSRGAHKVISGATNAAVPAMALAAPALIAAPGATALAVGGGLAGGKIASKGAEALGATPDQATLAGDAGNLAGGWAGTKIPAVGQAAAEFAGPKVTALAKTAAQDAASHIPFAGRVVRRPSIGDYWDAAKAQRPLENAGAKLPENPGESFLKQNIATPMTEKSAVFPPAPEYPGASLPAKPDAQFLKENMGVYPGAHLPEAPPPVFPGAKLPQNPGAKFLKHNIAVPEAPDATALNRPYAGENFGKVAPIKTPSGLNAENAAHSNSFFEQVKAEHPEMSVSQQLMEAAKRENAPAKGIPGKPTVIPAPSSEAYKSSAPPLEARIPGPDEDMTALLSKSVDNVKAPAYDDETVAAAAKGLEEQGYNPKDIQKLLQKMGLGPKTGMNVDEVFSQYPPGDTVQPFGKERAAAIEAQGSEADAIKSKLTKLRGVKVPPSPAMTPEEIKARLLKFQR